MKHKIINHQIKKKKKEFIAWEELFEHTLLIAQEYLEQMVSGWRGRAKRKRKRMKKKVDEKERRRKRKKMKKKDEYSTKNIIRRGWFGSVSCFG